MRIVSMSNTPLWEIPYRTAGPGGKPHVASLPLLQGTVTELPSTVEALLVCSDLQGRELICGDGVPPRLIGEVLASELAVLSEQGMIPPLHAIGALLVGDFFADASACVRGADGDVQPVWKAFSDRCRWTVGVAGNHDELDNPPVAGSASAHLLDQNSVEPDGLRIGGVSGIIGTTKKGRGWRREEAEFLAALRSVLADCPDLLLIHQGPDVVELRLPGHPAIREALDPARDLLTLCGHVGWPAPLATLPSGGQVLNVDGRAVLLVPHRR